MNALGPVRLILAGVLTLSACATFAQTAPEPSTTVQVPRIIRINGTLKMPAADASSGDVAQVNVGAAIEVRFALYADETGGDPLWEETQKVEVDAAGRYTVLLGATQPAGLPMELFTTGKAQWLETTRQSELETARQGQSDALREGEPAQPRIMLVSVPFALKAGDAETLGGKPASAYALAGGNQIPVAGAGSEPTRIGSLPGLAAKLANPNVVGATANYVPLFTSASGLTNSTMYEKAGNIGIGTTDPPGLFSVVGDENISVLAATKLPKGYGVYGANLSDAGAGTGVLGFVTSGGAIGVGGSNFGVSGDALGVLGTSTAEDGTAIKGINPYPKAGGQPTGVAGGVVNAGGVAGFFLNGAAKGKSLAVFGRTDAIGGTAVLGVADDTEAPAGEAPDVASLVRQFTARPAARKWMPNADLRKALEAHPNSFTTPDANVGVAGESYAAKGSTIGVFGEDASPSGVGGAFINLAVTGDAFGVASASTSSMGVGVFGGVTAGSKGLIPEPPRPVGVWGDTQNIGEGVLGTAVNAPGVMGVNKSANQAAGVFTNNDPNGTGVAGISTTAGGYAYGVYGQTSTGTGVLGVSGAGPGVVGRASASGQDGVVAQNSATSGNSNGLYATTQSAAGVAAYFDNLAGGYILVGAVNGAPEHMFHVDGEGDGLFAGDLDVGGDLNVDGSISKASGSFKIDDPIDPENKYLYHSFVESPDMMNVYNGNITTDGNGLATVALPAYFETLNRDFRYQLTVMGQFAQAIVADEIAGNRFTIRTDKPNVKVSWQVTGIRHDPWADAHRIPNEAEKPAELRGLYLHPELYGAGEEKSIHMKRRTPSPDALHEARPVLLPAEAGMNVMPK